jgi:trimeric autotransporter adhesin
MLRVKSILVGGVLGLWQLGCGGGSPRVGPPPPVSQANISISPANAIPGSPDLTLTITGSQAFSFTSAAHKFSEVVWFANASDTRLATTFVSGSQLTAIVPATLLVSPVQAQVRVEIWDVQGDAPAATSSAVPFSVTTASAASPSITSISPGNVSAGSPDVTLSITGSNFDHSFSPRLDST